MTLQSFRRSRSYPIDQRDPRGSAQLAIERRLTVIALEAMNLATLSPGTLIVDVSCDRGMGFTWARPTTFAEPSFLVGDNVRYYGVDHSPSYLWNSATWEISEALLPHLRSVLSGAWDTSDVIRRAIEIRDGVVQNRRILSFQHRSSEYPHAHV